MRNLGIQTLSVMLVLMTYTALELTKNQKHLLEQIIPEAQKMLAHSETLKVKWIQWPNARNVCWTEFFCLAEQALNKTELRNSSLKKMLANFNNDPESTIKANCLLEDNHQVNITDFLYGVVHCAKNAKHSNKTRKAIRRS